MPEPVLGVPTSDIFVGVPSRRTRRPEHRFPTISEGKCGRLIARLTCFVDDLVPGGRRDGWESPPGEVLADGFREEAASRHLEPAGAKLHLAKELIRDRDGSFHRRSITGYTLANWRRHDHAAAFLCSCRSPVGASLQPGSCASKLRALFYEVPFTVKPRDSAAVACRSSCVQNSIGSPSASAAKISAVATWIASSARTFTAKELFAR